MASSMRIAVTGGSGKVGRAVIAELVTRGHQVWNLDRRADPESKAKFVYVDLRERYQIQPALDQVEAVIHLGEIADVHRGVAHEGVYAQNCTAGSNILQTAAELKLKRVVYCSSCQVYGCWSWPTVPPVRLPVDETHPVQPQNVYALSKVSNERYAAIAAKDYGLSVAILRLPGVIPTLLMSRWRKWIGYKGYREEPEGFGTYVQDLDAGRAFAQAVEDMRPGCEIYNVAAEDVVYIKPVAEMHTGPYAPPAGWPPFKSLLNCEKIKAHFGWQPTWSFLDEYTKLTGEDPRKTHTVN